MLGEQRWTPDVPGSEIGPGIKTRSRHHWVHDVAAQLIAGNISDHRPRAIISVVRLGTKGKDCLKVMLLLKVRDGLESLATDHPTCLLFWQCRSSHLNEDLLLFFLGYWEGHILAMDLNRGTETYLSGYRNLLLTKNSDWNSTVHRTEITSLA